MWLVAFQDHFYTDDPCTASVDSLYLPAIQNILGGPALWNIPVAQYPIEFGTNYVQAERDFGWTNLLQYLSDTRIRNLYYFGHGGSLEIGADVYAYKADGCAGAPFGLPHPKASLSSQQVKEHIKPNVYRFVWLDGCDTATGEWPEAFGISSATNDVNFYTSADNTNHTRPSAFIGWNISPGGRDWGTNEQWWNFRKYWMSNWSVNNGNPQDQLLDILEDARAGALWVPHNQLFQHLIVTGYQQLKFNEYNNWNDWQWP